MGLGSGEERGTRKRRSKSYGSKVAKDSKVSKGLVGGTLHTLGFRTSVIGQCEQGGGAECARTRARTP